MFVLRMPCIRHPHGKVNMKKLNIYVALGSILISVLMLIIIPLQVSVAGSSAVGMTARTFPRFCAIGMLVCAVGLLVTTLIEDSKEKAPEIVKEEEKKVFMLLGLIIIYAIAMNFIGFFFATVIAGNVFLLMHKDRVWYHHVIYFVIILLSYLLFTRFLYIHLPKLGIWIF